MGRSSLLYLKHKVIAEVKIDRIFISGIKNNKEDSVIVKVIAALSKTLGLNLVTEGVESEQERKVLGRADYQTMQGYFLRHHFQLLK